MVWFTKLATNYNHCCFNGYKPSGNKFGQMYRFPSKLISVQRTKKVPATRKAGRLNGWWAIPRLLLPLAVMAWYRKNAPATPARPMPARSSSGQMSSARQLAEPPLLPLLEDRRVAEAAISSILFVKHLFFKWDRMRRQKEK